MTSFYRVAYAQSLIACTALLLLFALAAPPDGHAQSPPHRYPAYQDGQWGYIDTTGAMVIEPQFDNAARFSDSLARVRSGETVAFIDPSGDIVLEPEVDSVGHFSEGLAPARRAKGDPFGYIDPSGAFVIEPQFERAYAFSEGRAAVYTGDPKRAEAKFGYIDKTGDFVVEPQFSGARKYSGGLAPVLVDGAVSGKWGYIDESGELVIEPQFEEALPFSEGRAAVEVGDFPKWGYIDKQGQQVIEPTYGWARAFSGGLAPVKVRFEGPQYIDPKGNAVLQLEEYQIIDPFHGPLARVTGDGHIGGSADRPGGAMRFRHSNVADSSWIYLDREGRKVWP